MNIDIKKIENCANDKLSAKEVNDCIQYFQSLTKTSNAEFNKYKDISIKTIERLQEQLKFLNKLSDGKVDSDLIVKFKNNLPKAIKLEQSEWSDITSQKKELSYSYFYLIIILAFIFFILKKVFDGTFDKYLFLGKLQYLKMDAFHSLFNKKISAQKLEANEELILENLMRSEFEINEIYKSLYLLNSKRDKISIEEYEKNYKEIEKSIQELEKSILYKSQGD